MAKTRLPAGPGGSGAEKFAPAHPATPPARPDPPCCGNCAHWAPTGRIDDKPAGQCREGPPDVTGDPTDLGNLTRFRVTLATTCCGRHRPRSGSAA